LNLLTPRYNATSEQMRVLNAKRKAHKARGMTRVRIKELQRAHADVGLHMDAANAVRT
jgi:hypothetical protein